MRIEVTGSLYLLGDSSVQRIQQSLEPLRFPLLRVLHLGKLIRSQDWFDLFEYLPFQVCGPKLRGSKFVRGAGKVLAHIQLRFDDIANGLKNPGPAAFKDASDLRSLVRGDFQPLDKLPGTEHLRDSSFCPCSQPCSPEIVLSRDRGRSDSYQYQGESHTTNQPIFSGIHFRFTSSLSCVLSLKTQNLRIGLQRPASNYAPPAEPDSFRRSLTCIAAGAPAKTSLEEAEQPVSPFQACASS
jgi:hypothetical protein